MLLEEYNETEVLELFKEKGYEEERRSIMKSLISGYRSGAIKLVFAAQLAGDDTGSISEYCKRRHIKINGNSSIPGIVSHSTVNLDLDSKHELPRLRQLSLGIIKTNERILMNINTPSFLCSLTHLESQGFVRPSLTKLLL